MNESSKTDAVTFNGIIEAIYSVNHQKKLLKYNKKTCERLCDRCGSLITPLENLQQVNLKRKLRSASSSSIETEPTTNDSFVTGTTQDDDDTTENTNVNILENLQSLQLVVTLCHTFITKHGLVGFSDTTNEELDSEFRNLCDSLSNVIHCLNLDMDMDKSFDERSSPDNNESDEITNDDQFDVPLNVVPVSAQRDFNLHQAATLSQLRRTSPKELARLLCSPLTATSQLHIVCRAICYVCFNPVNKVLFGQSDGCGGLARLFKRNLSAEFVEICCLAIVSTCQDSHYNKIQFGSAGGCEALLSTIKKFKYYQTSVLEKACKAMATVCCRNELNIEILKKLDSHDALLKLVKLNLSFEANTQANLAHLMIFGQELICKKRVSFGNEQVSMFYDNSNDEQQSEQDDSRSFGVGSDMSADVNSSSSSTVSHSNSNSNNERSRDELKTVTLQITSDISSVDAELVTRALGRYFRRTADEDSRSSASATTHGAVADDTADYASSVFVQHGGCEGLSTLLKVTHSTVAKLTICSIARAIFASNNCNRQVSECDSNNSEQNVYSTVRRNFILFYFS